VEALVGDSPASANTAVSPLGSAGMGRRLETRDLWSIAIIVWATGLLVALLAVPVIFGWTAEGWASLAQWVTRASRDARRARGQSIGRPKALDQSKVALAQRMHASGESASTIAATLNVSRATVYRVLSGQA
jgi:hypothetical protein